MLSGNFICIVLLIELYTRLKRQLMWRNCRSVFIYEKTTANDAGWKAFNSFLIKIRLQRSAILFFLPVCKCLILFSIHFNCYLLAAVFLPFSEITNAFRYGKRNQSYP